MTFLLLFLAFLLHSTDCGLADCDERAVQATHCMQCAASGVDAPLHHNCVCRVDSFPSALVVSSITHIWSKPIAGQPVSKSAFFVKPANRCLASYARSLVVLVSVQMPPGERLVLTGKLLI